MAKRQERVKGSLGTRSVDDVDLEQWQFEVTSAGRIWYCIDDARQTEVQARTSAAA